MQFCENCDLLRERIQDLEDAISTLTNKYLIIEGKVKLLTEENNILKQSIRLTPPIQKRKKRETQELKECYSTIQKLKSIIQIKDSLLEVRNNIIKDGGCSCTQQQNKQTE